jgi:membrane associated rhomboid family serine protease
VVHGAVHDRLPPGFARRFGASVVFLGVYILALLPYIDHAAHGGGLAAGALLALVVPRRDDATPAPRWLALGGALGWAAVAASLVTSLAVLTLR